MITILSACGVGTGVDLGRPVKNEASVPVASVLSAAPLDCASKHNKETIRFVLTVTC
jgi:hypothetical protein